MQSFVKLLRYAESEITIGCVVYVTEKLDFSFICCLNSLSLHRCLKNYNTKKNRLYICMYIYIYVCMYKKKCNRITIIHFLLMFKNHWTRQWGMVMSRRRVFEKSHCNFLTFAETWCWYEVLLTRMWSRYGGLDLVSDGTL